MGTIFLVYIHTYIHTYVTEPGKRAQLAWSIIFFFLHFWNLRFITSLWIPEWTLEVLPSLSYRCLNTRSYKDRKRQKSILNVSGQIGRTFRAHRVPRVTKGRGSKNTIVYFVAYGCALNKILIFRICKAESRKSEPSLCCTLGMNEPVIGSKTSREGKWIVVDTESPLKTFCLKLTEVGVWHWNSI